MIPTPYGYALLFCLAFWVVVSSLIWWSLQ